MAAPSAIITHGSNALTLADGGYNITENLNDLDTGEFLYYSGEADALRAGDTVPDHAGMIIQSVRTNLTGVDYEHAVSAAGIAHTKSTNRTIFTEETPNEDGWDTASKVILTTNKAAVVLGTPFGVGNMYCTSVARASHPLHFGWYKLTAQYKGILANKPNKMRVQTSAREIFRDNVIVGFAGGWQDPQRGEILMPRPTVTLMFITNYVPSVTLPSLEVPTDAPSVIISYRMTGNATDATYHWPNGWALVSHTMDTIAGTNITLNEKTWVFNEKITF